MGERVSVWERVCVGEREWVRESVCVGGESVRGRESLWERERELWGRERV